MDDNEKTTEKSLFVVRQNRQKPISRQRHPHFHFREIDRLMYPLKSPHPSPHHLSPRFSKTFSSNLTSLNIQRYKENAEHRLGYKESSTTINIPLVKNERQERSAIKSFNSTDVNQSKNALSNSLTNLLKTEK